MDEVTNAIAVPDTSWMKHALCRGLDPNLFHPERGEHINQSEAMRICNGTQVQIKAGRKKLQVIGTEGCPVKNECLEFALSLPAHQDTCGVYGGVSHKTRLTMRRNRQPVLEFVPCGTVRAYRRHLRNGETPCSECRRANSDDKNLANLRRKLENQA